MDTQNFAEAFVSIIKPNDHILDIGGGQGDFAQKFIERGAHVTIVDPKTTLVSSDQITVYKMTIEAFCAEPHPEMYTAIFARNVIQFLDRAFVFEILLPWMKEHLDNHGLIAIKTFYQNPEPPFDRPVTSLYELTELSAHFIAWPELLTQQYRHRGLDMSGQARQFYTTDIIVRKGQP